MSPTHMIDDRQLFDLDLAHCDLSLHSLVHKIAVWNSQLTKRVVRIHCERETETFKSPCTALA